MTSGMKKKHKLTVTTQNKLTGVCTIYCRTVLLTSVGWDPPDVVTYSRQVSGSKLYDGGLQQLLSADGVAVSWLEGMKAVTK